MLIFYYVLVLLLFAPSSAYAYLDPGTGNILVYIVISLVGAFIFSLKGLFYAIIGKGNISHKPTESMSISNDIVIFSEGKNYWNTFSPVVNALIEHKQPFSYYTMDVDDPCLKIENDIINNRYIGKNNIAFAKIGKLKAGVVLSTTPNIGTEGFPLPRSKNIKCLVHVFHAVDDLAYYHKGSLDNYDAVLLVGKFEEPIIRRLEDIRCLKHKELIPAGLPYLDLMASKMDASQRTTTDGKTILIAPSWGEKSCLNIYGDDFIVELAKYNYHIIIRPHPQSWKVEKNLLERTRSRLSKFGNVEWDTKPDGALSMAKADLLISDTSAIRLDYALLYQRPVITLESPLPDPNAFELSDLEQSWMDTAVDKIGFLFNKKNIASLSTKVQDILSKENRYDLLSFRNETIYNWGKSGEVIANYLISKSKELSNTDNGAK